MSKLTRRELLRATFAAGGLAAATAGTLIAAPEVSYPPDMMTTAEESRLRDLAVGLKRHAAWLIDPSKGQRWDRLRIDLRDIGLTGGSLRNANLDGTDLQGCQLIDVDLTGASFVGANLTRARMKQCLLIGTNFTAAAAVEADFNQFIGDSAEPTALKPADQVCFRHADLRNARLALGLDRGDFSEADLRHADFSDSFLETYFFGGITFAHAQLDHAKFANSQIMLIDFSDAAMTNVDMAGLDVVASTFKSVNFAGAVLRGTKMVGCDLRGINWDGADLRRVALENSIYHDRLEKLDRRAFPSSCRLDGLKIS